MWDAIGWVDVGRGRVKAIILCFVEKHTQPLETGGDVKSLTSDEGEEAHILAVVHFIRRHRSSP